MKGPKEQWPYTRAYENGPTSSHVCDTRNLLTLSWNMTLTIELVIHFGCVRRIDVSALDT